MALNPAPGYLLVKPTGDNNEHESEGGLHVVTNEQPERTIQRGVVMGVGQGFESVKVEIGYLVHYLSFYELFDLHAVWHGQVLAWEDNE